LLTRQLGNASDRIAGKDTRTGRIDWQRADLSAQDIQAHYSADERELRARIRMHLPV